MNSYVMGEYRTVCTDLILFITLTIEVVNTSSRPFNHFPNGLFSSLARAARVTIGDTHMYYALFIHLVCGDPHLFVCDEFIYPTHNG